MRRSRDFALLVALCAFLWSPSAFAASNTVTKLPVTSYHKEMLRVDGDVLVWEDTRSSADPNFLNDAEIFAYDMSTGVESAIATGAGLQTWPAISGNTIVWWDLVTSPGGYVVEEDIRGYDLVTKTKFPVSTAPGLQRSPEISGNLVVWEDYRNSPPGDRLGNGDIYAYDLQTLTEFPVVTDPGTQYQPDVWGDWVVWTDGSNSSNFNIKAKNIRTGERVNVCSDPGRQDYPRIDNGLVIWQDYTTGGGDIKGYDLTTRTRVNLAVTSAGEHSPEISGNIAAWLKIGSNGNSIVGWDRLSGSSFTIQPTVATNSFGALSGGRVAWLGHSGTSTDIYVTRVTQDEGIAGAGRYETAVQASKAAFPTGSDTVVIATGQNWPDALGGSALAGALDAPLLLTPRDSLSPVVTDEIVRLHATKAVVLGSEAAVGPAPLDSLVRLLGEGNVSRIGGSSRYETASKVASEAIADQAAAYDGTAFVATGSGFADAMSASPLAALKGWPVFLAEPSGVSADTLATMKSRGVTRVILLGSYKVISDAEMVRLRGEFGEGNVFRLGGDNRYATAVAIGDYAVGSGLLDWNDLAVATGENYPDGLTGGVLQAKRGAPVLLTNRLVLSGATASALRAHDPAIDKFTYLGTTAAVGAPVRKAIRDILR